MPKNFKDLIVQNNKTAYELTKLYCQFSVDSGRDVPTVAEIQNELGKGSVRDISKAQADFKKERQEFLDMVDTLQISHLPWSLIRTMKELWLMAKTTASEQHKEELAKAKEQIVELQAEIEHLKKEMTVLNK